ncbi:hypothetical protein GCM10010385_06390 [Streptomyces geysiriensis]|nr:hypothetical protein JCM4020_10190 [Streptomyces coelicolor]GGY60075.1 hypothetical protein GCM10010385_06390 [Streptomyces geysiriensis]GGZ78637.1 hypothetical protein GCM10010301_59970 [Streptomyces plicatus]
MIVPVTARRPRAARTPVPIWHINRPTVAPRSTRQAIRTERRTSEGRRRAMVREVNRDPARSLDSSR